MTSNDGVMAPSLQTHSAESSAPVSRGERGLTPKALVIAMLLIPLNVFWIIQLEVVRYTHPTLIHPLLALILVAGTVDLVGRCEVKQDLRCLKQKGGGLSAQA